MNTAIKGIVVSLFVAFAVVLLSSANWIMAALATVQLARAPAVASEHQSSPPNSSLQDGPLSTPKRLATGDVA